MPPSPSLLLLFRLPIHSRIHSTLRAAERNPGASLETQPQAMNADVVPALLDLSFIALPLLLLYVCRRRLVSSPLSPRVHAMATLGTAGEQWLYALLSTLAAHHVGETGPLASLLFKAPPLVLAVYALDAPARSMPAVKLRWGIAASALCVAVLTAVDASSADSSASYSAILGVARVPGSTGAAQAPQPSLGPRWCSLTTPLDRAAWNTPRSDAARPCTPFLSTR